MKKIETTRLPDKLSDLLELAIKDCLRISKRKDHVLDMRSWLVKDGEGCYACMAGAVMLCELKDEAKEKMSEGWDLTPSSFTADAQNKLLAINYLRTGDLSQALYSVNRRSGGTVEVCRRVKDLVEGDWDLDRDRANWKTYRKVVTLLRENGL